MLTPQINLGNFSCKKACFPVDSFDKLLYSSSSSYSTSGGKRSSGVLEGSFAKCLLMAKKSAWTTAMKFMTCAYLTC